LENPNRAKVTPSSGIDVSTTRRAPNFVASRPAMGEATKNVPTMTAKLVCTCVRVHPKVSTK
jgi:hypothetical protein